METNSYRQESPKRRRLVIGVLTTFLICSSLLNIILARKIKNLNSGILYLKAEMKQRRELKPGDVMPPIQTKDSNEAVLTESFQNRNTPTIVYIFSPDCSWCTRNLSNIKILLAQTKDKYRFIGLSLDSKGLQEYIAQHQLDFSIYTNLTEDTALAYKGGTPRTFVVSDDGVILKSWFGAYNGENRKEVEDYFKIRLNDIGDDNNKKNCETCDQEANNPKEVTK